MANGLAIHSLSFNAGIGQPTHQSIADYLEIWRRGLASNVHVRSFDSPIDDQSYPTLLSPPGELTDFGIFKKTAWFRDGLQVLFHQLEVKLSEF
ncbi:hypothetical protein EY04_24055 [Pseudomonas chlororaphis]|nr:hypothetical protein EY04_24055 [Pseudomonas chlororaphis]